MGREGKGRKGREDRGGEGGEGTGREGTPNILLHPQFQFLEICLSKAEPKKICPWKTPFIYRGCGTAKI